MIAHRGIYQGRTVTLIAINRYDIATMLSGLPIIGSDFVVHFYESESDARKHAADILFEGEQINER